MLPDCEQLHHCGPNTQSERRQYLFFLGCLWSGKVNTAEPNIWSHAEHLHAQVLSVYQRVLWESAVTRNLRNSEISAPKQIESMVQAWPCQSTQSLGWLFADNVMECENFSTFNQKTVIFQTGAPSFLTVQVSSFLIPFFNGRMAGETTKDEGNDGQTWFTWVVFGVMRWNWRLLLPMSPWAEETVDRRFWPRKSTYISSIELK